MPILKFRHNLFNFLLIIDKTNYFKNTCGGILFIRTTFVSLQFLTIHKKKVLFLGSCRKSSRMLLRNEFLLNGMVLRKRKYFAHNESMKQIWKKKVWEWIARRWMKWEMMSVKISDFVEKLWAIWNRERFM